MQSTNSFGNGYLTNHINESYADITGVPDHDLNYVGQPGGELKSVKISGSLEKGTLEVSFVSVIGKYSTAQTNRYRDGKWIVSMGKRSLNGDINDR